MGEGWHHLQTWENPPATVGTMVAMTLLCCYPHIMVCLAATGLVFHMVSASSEALHSVELLVGINVPSPMKLDWIEHVPSRGK